MKNHGHPRVMALYAEFHILRYGLITAKEEPRICLDVWMLASNSISHPG